MSRAVTQIWLAVSFLAFVTLLAVVPYHIVLVSTASY